MLTQEKAEALANHWIQSWNSHNIEAILAHYSNTVVFSSPLIAKILGNADGTIIGKDALRDYFIAGLARFPELKFELLQVFSGCNSLVIHYKSVNNLIGAEVMILDGNLNVKSCLCHYKTIAA